MIIVDTNVWSETTKPAPSRRVVDWLKLHRGDVAITAITVGEMLTGLQMMAPGSRREILTLHIERLIAAMRDQILVYDERAARAMATVVSNRRRVGRSNQKSEDSMIAAIALAHGCPVATRNVKDFRDTGIELINPWEHAQ